MIALAIKDWVPEPLLTPQVRGMIGFTLRNWLASMLALYIAFALQLESPVWSWLTVWIVAQPTPGMVLSKSLYRVIGTIAGAFMGVILIALFSQAPDLFVLALALMVGGCTVASNILTNFRAYATVLAGYTAGIVASDAINAPDQVFFIAMARASAILVGIACGVIVNSLFAPHRAEGVTRGKLSELLKEAAHRAVLPWQTPIEERLVIGKKLIDDAIALDTLIEFAAAESGIFRLQANNARSLVSHVLGLVSARRSLDAHLKRCGWPKHDALQIFHGVVIDLLNDLPAQLDRGKIDEQITAIADVRRQLALLNPEEVVDTDDLVSARLVIDRIDDLLEHLGRALVNWRDICEERWHRTPTRTLNFHRDVRLAWINGLRAFVAIGITGAFWIGTAWPHGPGALVFVCVMLSLFSSFPRPDLVSWTFFLASTPGVIVALICKYLVLAPGAGFDYLMVATAIFIIPMGLIMANPSTTFVAVAFSFVFLNLVGPANPQVYDLADSLNTAIALEFGVLAGVASYVLIYPPNPVAARRYVTYRIRRGLDLLASLQPIPHFSHWETRMYDRVNRLHDPKNPSGVHTDEWFEAGLGALTLGNEILRLRHWLAEEKLPPSVKTALESVIGPLKAFTSAPDPAYAALKLGRDQIAQLDPGPHDPDRRAWARVLGALEEMDVYLAVHPRLLNRQPIT
jgi:uncharacterized membrane protein YccC